jgi:dTDP-glucose pyrophosphorylase
MFIIPMVGKSSRFFSEGYTLPKYRLPLGEGFVFDYVMKSFASYFLTDRFIFICRKDFNDYDFIYNRIKFLGINNFEIVQTEKNTLGQAHSVYIATEMDVKISEELYIFNIDTILFDFKKPLLGSEVFGFMEVFRGEGSHWSFAVPDSLHNFTIMKVVEKERVSDLCSNGLYYFKSLDVFRKAFATFIDSKWDGLSELYVAPLYNCLIEIGGVVKYFEIEIEAIGFCGTPDEYKKLFSQLNKSNDR